MPDWRLDQWDNVVVRRLTAETSVVSSLSVGFRNQKSCTLAQVDTEVTMTSQPKAQPVATKINHSNAAMALLHAVLLAVSLLFHPVVTTKPADRPLA